MSFDLNIPAPPPRHASGPYEVEITQVSRWTWRLRTYRSALPGELPDPTGSVMFAHGSRAQAERVVRRLIQQAERRDARIAAKFTVRADP